MKIFTLVIIKPTHFDDRGYLIRWYRTFIPANTLAVMNGLAEDAARRAIFGSEIELRIVALDECNYRLDSDALISQIRLGGAGGMVALVGVQTNQYPRAMEVAKVFRQADIPVVIGGFHVSGCVAMLDELPQELKDAQAIGVSLFAGEAEEDRFDEVLRDAYRGTLKPLYNYLDAPPSLEGQPVPRVGEALLRRTEGTGGYYSSFDLGRGCPFSCSFCTIINVQGRKSRFRSADDLERIIRESHAQGVAALFVTDDNLARNKNWEACFDRLIALKKEGISVRLVAQVDVKSHKIPRFIEKAVQAGVDQIFIGLESVSSENLLAVGKRQNNINEYRKMMLAWKRYPVVITAGYIIGFPADTPESIRRDIDILKNELPLDTVYFSYLTPLPGSADHKMCVEQNIWLDPDLNRYDLGHAVTNHPRMSKEQWDAAVYDAHRLYYSFEHMTTVLRRMVALGSNKKLTTLNRLVSYREFMRLHRISPLEGGMVRMMRRSDRSAALPRESWPRFVIYWVQQCILAYARMAFVRAVIRIKLAMILRDPRSREWRDAAITADKGTKVDVRAEGDLVTTK